ncbi:DUF6538 domain-containing protein [Yoonia sediminilitoris]|uniref:Site-specific recombinase XerD n=1 Tax=Yoonia sediminilitoris TaxID=1286148 RepID=A0A2T6KI25_9RHOB|nr:DUF6538 domain-containing protein [Yoonia sediminilitoris]PUB15386.1 site-specific recombinase XerD [Yoonia sediminilitoris]RCW95996.1 site-specific recombinase XerD [Yoonia sediminilitoris]
MVLQMSRPHKNSKSGVYYFRQKTPADVRRTFGKAEVIRSLRTKNAEVAKERHAEESRKQALVWQSLRAAPATIPHKQLVAITGDYYRSLNEMVEDEPGESSLWKLMAEKFDGIEDHPESLLKWFGEDADRLLSERGLAADARTRQRLCEELSKTWRQWYDFQLARSEGDYSPDPKAGRFPAMKEPKGQPKDAVQAVSMTSLFELWERDHIANGKPKKTAEDFRQKISNLKAFLGHDDAKRVTGEDIVNWCEHLQHEKKLSAKTVRDKYLVAAKAVFNTGTGKKRLHENPADGVKVTVPKRQKLRPSGFTDAEAKAILTATLRDPKTLGGMREHNKLAIRWVPWICAYSGARVTEITQLRQEDLISMGEIPCMRITPEAGSVKSGNYRVVPLHPHLIEMGLPQVFSEYPTGPLFYSPKTPGEVDVKRAQSVGKKVGQWVREIAGIKDALVQPNHAWRHRFKTIARDADILPEYADAIQGHEDGRASTDYGETTVKALWREIQKLPRYEIE